MQCTILRWLLGIWLVETVAARTILNGEEGESGSGNVGVSRNGRDQYHRQPFYNSPHFSYNSFMSSVRARRPPQVPGRRNLVETDASNDHPQTQYNNHYNNYFTNDRSHRQNQQNLNVYSAVRLHGALEARAKAEPGSNTLVPTTHHTNYFHPLEEQQQRRPVADRQWRRDNAEVDGESYENHEDLARFSLYNSYFDNEHSIKALNSMKCVTPTGSPGFCSTFRGCVPSFFTADGQLEAPALAELISTSIGYCTTNVSHHYIREQREQQFSREERRFNSVANRIICCPGVAPMRNPNLDPDKIFMDFWEKQNQKQLTSTSTTTTTTVLPEVSEPENAIDGASSDSIGGVKGDGSQSQQTDEQSSSPASVPEEGGSSDDGERPSQDGSQSSSSDDTSSASSPVPVETSPEANVPVSEQPEQEVPTTVQPIEQSSEVPSTEGESQPEANPSSEPSSDDQSYPEQPEATYPPEQLSPSTDQPSMTYPPEQEPSMEEKPVAIYPVEQPDSDDPEMSNLISSSSSSAPPVDNAEPAEDGESSQAPAQNDEPDITTYPPSTSSPGTQPPAPASPGGESRPIIIVTNNPNPMPGMLMPSFERPAVPMFPSDFPPMGSAESIPPVDDSSLELQPRPVSSYPKIPTSSQSPVESSSSSSSAAASTPDAQQTQSNIESEATTANVNSGASGQQSTESESSSSADTTNEPHQIQQDEGVDGATTQGSVMTSGGNMQHQQQQDESDIPIITTVQPDPQQPVVVPTAPLMDDEENDALTILPIQESASEKSGSTTEIPAAPQGSSTLKYEPQPADAIAGGDASQSQQTGGGAGGVGSGGVNDITTASSIPASPQEAEITTVSSQSPANSEEETTTLAATTQGPNDDESEESNESAEDDINKTTTVNPDVENADLNRVVPTTTFAPQSQDDESLSGTTAFPVSGGGGVHDHQFDESMKPMMPESGHDIVTSLPPNSESQVTDTPPQKIVLNPGSESDDSLVPSSPSDSGSIPVQDQPENVEGSEGQISETVQPFPVSSPATPTGEPEQKQQPFPGSEQQQQQTTEGGGAVTNPPPTATEPQQQQPFPGSEGDQQRPVSDDESSTASASQNDESVQGIESGSTSESSQTTNVGEPAGVPTTGAPAGMEQHDDSSSGSSQVGGETTSHPGGLPSADEGAEGGVSESLPGSGNESVIGSTSESSPVSGSETVSADGSESPSEGSGATGSGTESSISGDDSGSHGGSTQSSISGGGADSSNGGEPILSDPSVSSSGSEDELTDGNNPAGQSTSASPSQGNGISTQSPIYPEGGFTDPPQEDQSFPSSGGDDSSNVGDEIPLSSSTPASAATTGGGVTEAEATSEDTVSSVSPVAVEDASPLPGSSPSAVNSSIPSDHVQDPQPIVSTTEASQIISSSEAPNDGSSSSGNTSVSPYPGMMLPTTSSTKAPSSILATNEDRFQILKACKFQSYFRSNMAEDDMDYSYRHYPWLATIVGGTRPFSSGTLITDRHILTAAHFLANITVSDVFNMRIHVGYRTSFTGNTEGPYAVRKVRKVIRHKGFSFEKLYNDIAVLVLDRPVRFSEDIYPVCISSKRDAYEDGTAEAFETGWIEDPRTYTISQHHNYVDPHIQKYFSFGYKNITWRLQEAPQRVRTNPECQGNYGFLEKNGIMVTDSMVCAGSGDTRSCAFRGNSGAPLFMRNEDDKMTEQVGIVSWGIGCGHFPFVFTRVESFLPWLDRVVYNSR